MSWTKITIGGQAVEDAEAFLKQLTYRPAWADKANRISLPCGTQPGGGVFLMTPTAFGNLSLTTQHNVVWTEGSGESSTDHTMYGYVIKRAYEAIPATGSPIVVEIADARQMFLDSATSKRFNVRGMGHPTYETASLKSGSPYDWDEIAEAYWADVNSGDTTFSAYGISGASHSDTPLNVVPQSFLAWQEIRRLAWRLGQEVNLDVFANRVQIGALPSGGINNTTVTFGKDACNDNSPSTITYGIIPETVNVKFRWWPGFDSDILTDCHTVSVDVEDDVSWPFGFTVGVTAGATATVWSETVAYRPSSGTTPTNAALLTTEAERVAGGLVRDRARAANPSRVRYPEFLEVGTAQYASEVIWSVEKGQTFTEIINREPPPLDPLPWQPPPIRTTGLLYAVPDGGISAQGTETCALYVVSPAGTVLPASDGNNALSLPVKNMEGKEIPEPETSLHDYAVAGFIGGKLVNVNSNRNLDLVYEQLP